MAKRRGYKRPAQRNELGQFAGFGRSIQSRRRIRSMNRKLKDAGQRFHSGDQYGVHGGLKQAKAKMSGKTLGGKL